MEAPLKTCANCNIQFPIEPEDTEFYRRIDVPEPTWCPECRFERRAAYRNERKIFWTKSALSGRRMLSLYPASSGLTVYHEDEWKSDSWDGLEYGREYDFSRPFFDQFHDLAKAVPRDARPTEPGTNIGSDYTANASHVKNCYLVFNGDELENCAYGNGMNLSRECFEASYLWKSELCYEMFHSANCYRTHFSSHCEDCVDSWMLKNCTGCVNCFGCVNLRDKTYHFLNEKLTKNEYEKRLAALRLDTWTGLTAAMDRVRAFQAGMPVRYIQGVKNTNVTGEYVSHSRNIHRGYLVRESENLRYCQYQMVPTNRDCMDITVWGGGNELCYENVTCGWGAANLRFCVECWPETQDCEYSMFLRNCANCFGCFGLRHKQYCILNKQYTPEKYRVLRAKIRAHMDEMPYRSLVARPNDPSPPERSCRAGVGRAGRLSPVVYRYGEFFPPEHAPFGHNTSIAGEHFPRTREEVLGRGWPWDEPEAHAYKTTIAAAGLPDAIGDVPKDITKEIIACADCGHAYRVIDMELQFLRHAGIPLPRQCVECRHKRRIAERNGFRLWKRRCMCAGADHHDDDNNDDDSGHSDSHRYRNTAFHFHGEGPCPNEFETSYSPERPEMVYCERCYQAEVA